LWYTDNKLFIILREDLLYNAERLLYIGNSIPYNKIKETLMVFNKDYLHNIENILIEEGLIFSWIEENNVLIGIYFYVPREKATEFRNNYLYDCLNLNEYSKYKETKYPL